MEYGFDVQTDVILETTIRSDMSRRSQRSLTSECLGQCASIGVGAMQGVCQI
jgi:hypothetical protein